MELFPSTNISTVLKVNFEILNWFSHWKFISCEIVLRFFWEIFENLLSHEVHTKVSLPVYCGEKRVQSNES
jgi:hypothetical protein